jgi:hypothetical protein
VPIDRRPDIERLSGCAVTVESMGDDARWVRVPDPSWPHPGGRPCRDLVTLDLVAPEPATAAGA